MKFVGKTQDRIRNADCFLSYLALKCIKITKPREMLPN